MISEVPDLEVQVLLLDGLPADAGLIRDELRRAGIGAVVRQVDRCKEYVEALDARRPDVVMADPALPAVGSDEALRLARARHPDVPFIFVSGSNGEKLAVEAMNHGATDYVLRDHLVRLGPAVRRALGDVAQHREKSHAEHQLRLIADAVPSLMSYVDLEWRYVFANQAYTRWFGIRQEDLPGKRVWEVLGAEPFAAIRPFLERAFAGERVEFDVQIPYRGTGLHWMSVVYTPDVRPDGKVAGIFVLASDITGRKKIEEAGSFLSEATGLLVSSLDYEATLLNIARLAVPRVADLCAVCFEHNGDVLPLVIVHQDPARSEHVNSVLARYPLQKDLPFAYPKVLRTGEWDLVPELTDDLLRLASRNEDQRRLLGELEIRSILTVPLVVAGRTVAALTLAFSESGRRYGLEDVAFAEELARRAALAVENARLYRAARRESEEHKLAVEALRDLNDHLEQRVRERTAALQEITRELDAFASTAAHDLRAPLRVMKAFSEVLLEDYSGKILDPEGQEYARKIDRATDRMSGLVEDLLSYSRLARQDVPIQDVDLEEVVDGVLSDMADEFRASGGAVTVDRPLPPVRGNAGLFAQVLRNLLSNALKFRVPGEPARVHVRAERDDGSVRLWVEDQGIGIDRANFERIFKVFERLHSQTDYPGSGLGLAIARRSIERMGGTIGVESEPGRGSRFWIRLPALQERP